MTLLNWYSISASPFFNWLGRAFDRSFHAIIKLGFGPDAFYIILVCVLLVIWLGVMRRYDSQAKDKGLID
jgi:hypothetical protein